MAILIDQKTRALVQGITGKEGSRAAAQMKNYGTRVVAGVTPGKGGETVESIPVYDTVAEAKAAHPEVNATFIAVPAAGLKEAALEAIDAGIPLISILTEHVPIHNSADILAAAREKGARVVGPSSIGIISPGKAKIGSIGGDDPSRVYTLGKIGVISKSGGMLSEVSWLLKRAGLGVSTGVGIGGDYIIGSDFADLMEMFQKDKETAAVVIFGEVGGTYEERAAELMRQKKFTKPVVAFITGRFIESLPQGMALGHAGAIIEGGKGTLTSKVAALKASGALIAKVPDEIPDLVKRALKK